MTEGFFKQIVQLIENKIGLKPNSVSRLIWEWILKERMALSNISSYEAYLNKLYESPAEVQELIELIIVPETWFFRDKTVYEFLSYYIREEWLAHSKGYFLRILSIPCSTGEEPYSIAMALLDEGLPKTSFCIDASDISQRSLTQAHIGIYGKKSFRTKDLNYRSRYFTKTNEGYALNNQVKEHVHLYNFNILNTQHPFVPHSYQLIFFRNLLIYLNPAAQQQAFKLIKQLLHPSGILIVGAAEVTLARKEGFVPCHYMRSYAFHLEEHAKLNKTDSLKIHREKPLDEVFKRIDMQVEAAPSPTIMQESTIEAVPSAKTDDRESLLQESCKLADSGYFEEATDLCLRYINQFGAHPQIYFLLGLMQHASGYEKRAEEFFEKTVYLQPAHYEALIYLSLLCEKRGDAERADLFKRRALKVYQASTS